MSSALRLPCTHNTTAISSRESDHLGSAEDRRAYQTVHDVKVEIFASPHEAAHAACCQRQSHEVRDVGAASCPPASPAPIGHGTSRLICEQFLLSISYWEHSRFLTGKPRTCSHPWIVGSAFWSKFLTSRSMLFVCVLCDLCFLGPTILILSSSN